MGRGTAGAVRDVRADRGGGGGTVTDRSDHEGCGHVAAAEPHLGGSCIREMATTGRVPSKAGLGMAGSVRDGVADRGGEGGTVSDRSDHEGRGHAAAAELPLGESHIRVMAATGRIASRGGSRVTACCDSSGGLAVGSLW